jgi:hypothetical protein
MNRKIIQITTIGHADSYEVVYALCDDGSVWRLFVTSSGIGDWHRIQEIPQK